MYNQNELSIKDSESLEAARNAYDMRKNKKEFQVSPLSVKENKNFL